MNEMADGNITERGEILGPICVPASEEKGKNWKNSLFTLFSCLEEN